MTQEAQWQAAKAAQPGPAPEPPAAHAPAPDAAPSTKRPSNVALAGAGSILAVLAFLGGMAVGHSWDGTSTQQNQFGGPGGGGFGRGFQGQGNGQGLQPGQGTLPGQGTQQQPGTTQNG
ncbi:hypothetical protein OHA10_08770 [Kribbella sp. NBC_00662]|uniref:hypothetical protein n=1 Tax=Kribbella sp. NBC_00662 TaxID=2975969 RepID=UPI0032553D48